MEPRRTSLTKLAAILDQIDSGSVLLPEFQREYVWNRDQVRGLMRSLYLDYPVGSLLTWETQAEGSFARGAAATTPTLRVLILDGQQRVTSLYGITRGRPPVFFAGMYAAATRKLSAPWRNRPTPSPMPRNRHLSMARILAPTCGQPSSLP
jgi:hypothetical protein